MTDEQIKKALECCVNDDEGVRGFCNKGCPLFGKGENCPEVLRKNALDLINRQKAEIERWKEQNVRLDKECDHFIRFASAAKSEAYKEFAERLHQNCEKHPYTLPYVLANIEITYKELTEGGNEDG